jgi:N-formylglutamate amidohydrolase
MDIGSTSFVPVSVLAPACQAVPVVLASPHSGRCYPAEFLAAARLDSLAIRRSEDGFVDELFADAPGLGIPLLAANFPRAYCDVNREAWELDPAMFEDSLPHYVNAASARVGAGLGTIARIVASGETIYRRKLRFAEAEARVQACWHPFHAALRGLIEETVARFDACLLVDCHSMPAATALRAGHATPDIVLGDAHGTACAGRLTGFVETALRGMGFSVRRNDPYAGGYITRHYGRPRERVHVLQLEIARGLYMDERTMQKTAGFEALRAALAALLGNLSACVPPLLA